MRIMYEVFSMKSTRAKISIMNYQLLDYHVIDVAFIISDIKIHKIYFCITVRSTKITEIFKLVTEYNILKKINIYIYIYNVKAWLAIQHKSNKIQGGTRFWHRFVYNSLPRLLF